MGVNNRYLFDKKFMNVGFCNTSNSNSQVKTNPWSNTVTVVNGEKRIYHYDAEHERKRKEQLRRLFDRTQEQVALPCFYLTKYYEKFAY